MRKLALILCVSSIATSSVYADNNDFYAGVSYGKSKVDTGVSNTTGTASLDENDNGFKFFAGINLNENFSIEGHYLDMGEAKLTGNNGDTFAFKGTTYTFTANNVVIKQEAKTYGISGVLKLPINDTVTPFAKVGFHKWDATSSIASSAGNASLDDDGTDPFYGLGLSVSVTDNINVRAEFEHFEFDSEDADYASIGVAYSF